jgi:hypothetical protein
MFCRVSPCDVPWSLLAILSATGLAVLSDGLLQEACGRFDSTAGYSSAWRLVVMPGTAAGANRFVRCRWLNWHRLASAAGTEMLCTR